MSKYITYIGTYADHDYGIPVLSVNSETGAMELLSVCRGYERPTYLRVSADKRFLYACAGLEEFAESGRGALVAFAIQGTELNLLNARPSLAGPPCYIMSDQHNQFLFAANYHEGTGVAYRLAADGSIQENGEALRHTGRGPHPTRQEQAHLHCMELSPSGEILYAVDLGIDTVKAYALGQGERILTPLPSADLHEEPGAGPRHIVFRRDGKFAYLINELASTVSVWDVATPTAPQRLQTLSILPKSYQGANTAAAIKLSEDGTRLCCSNRGDDSLAIFAVEAISGLLALMNISPTLGRGPRDFEFVPGGRFILVAHQYTDTLVMHEFDAENGCLKTAPADMLALSQQPVCIKFGSALG
ncbi:MAG: lactonase family protein [Lentisphaeria bacterium]